MLRSTRLAYVIFGIVLILGCQNNSSKSQTTSCPQIRNTEYAPARIAALNNPLSNNKQAIENGETLFNHIPESVSCSECHGRYGDGNGAMASMFSPAPRNFTCSITMSTLPDGQLYWIIKNGSVGTSMPAFNKLSDQNIWQLVAYVRTLEIVPDPKPQN